MSARGGRGSGGRGRGRGWGQPHPVARDDEGNQLPTQLPSGPPPLYPEVKKEDLPAVLPIDSEAERWLRRKREWLRALKNSSFYLGDVKKKAGPGGLSELDGFGDTAASQLAAKDKPPLHSVMTLRMPHFPEELYCTRDQRASTKASSSAAQQQYWQNVASRRKLEDDDPGIARMDALADMESRGGQATGASPDGVKREADGDAEGGGKRPKTGGDEDRDDQDQLEAEDEDEGYVEDDDYCQGEQFDDDEGYDDLDDGDEGPLY